MKQFKSDQEAFAAGQRTARQWNGYGSTRSLPKFRAEDDGDDALDDGDDDDEEEECVASFSKGHYAKTSSTGGVNIFRKAKK